jgi:hypothetical protein
VIHRSDLVLWLALLAGFSPVLFEFAASEASFHPVTAFVAPLLIAICAWRGVAVADEPRRSGLALIAAGLLLELLGIALRTWTLMWLGLPVAVVGMALWIGRPTWRVAALAFGLVPVPVSLIILFTPAAESAILRMACGLWRAVGVSISCTGPIARVAGRSLDLVPADAGWTLAALLAQLGWFAAVSRGASGGHALRTALLYASAALVLQPLAVALAVGLFAAFSADAARAWLSTGLFIACTATALFWPGRAAPAREPA